MAAITGAYGGLSQHLCPIMLACHP